MEIIKKARYLRCKTPARAAHIFITKDALKHVLGGIHQKFVQIRKQYKKLHTINNFDKNRRKSKFPWRALAIY